MLATCTVRPLAPPAPLRRPLTTPAARRGLGGHPAAATADDGGPSPPPPPAEDLAAVEARLEALERGARRGTGSAGAARPTPTSPATTSPLAEWKDGARLPEGFAAMPPALKVYNLWAGRRGALYWASQSAWYSAIGLGGGWILFRFVLPALGVYKLANGLTD